jgi:hypothetical protein
MTEYVILSRGTTETQGDETGTTFSGGYQIRARVKARGVRAALTAFLSDKQDATGEYVAVPARSWKPVTVKVETKTALKFS